MQAFQRPVVENEEFLDADGAPIAYGTRWGGGSPPENTYSVTTHPQRFAPLEKIADALIEWLVGEFDAEAVDSLEVASDVVTPLVRDGKSEIARAVRVTPAEPSAARITVIYTLFPGIVVHAGLLHDFLFPVCGCDACDEPWDGTADDLEWTLRTIVGGGYSETYDPERSLAVGFALSEDGVGGRSGSTGHSDIPVGRLDAAIPALTGGRQWSAWPERGR